MTTKPQYAEVSPAETCTCRRKSTQQSRFMHEDRCAYVIADHRAWEVWDAATTAWEARAQADIDNGTLSAEALDFIEDRDAERYGQMSQRTRYCLKFLRAIPITDPMEVNDGATRP